MQKIPQEHLEALLESEKQEVMGKVEYSIFILSE